MDGLIDWIAEWSEAISGFGSILLTSFLVYLYFRQTKIQEGQREIQERQEIWMEADHKPILNIIDYSFTDESGLDIVKLDIENIGYGTARNIRCFCKIYITPLDSEIYHGEYLTVEKYINECPLSYKIDKLFPYPDHISVEDVWFEPGEYPFDATLQHYSTVRNGTSLSGSEFAKVESVALYYLWTKTEGSLSKATFRFRTMIDILQESILHKCNML